jgi:peroxin-7
LINFKEHTGEAFGVSWSHLLSNLVLTGGYDSTIKIYDLNLKKLVGNLAEHKSIVYNVNWHPTMANLFASTSGDNTLKIWDTKLGKSVKTIRASNTDVLCCDFNKYDNVIATSSANGEVCVFDLRSGGDTPLVKLNGHRLSSKKCMFSPFFSSILASVGYDMNLILWDVKKNAPISTFQHHREFVMGLDFSIFDNKKIATAAWDRTMWVFKWDESLKI